MTSFRRYVARRLFLTAVTFFGVVVAVFVLTFVLPGDVATLKAGEYADEELLAQMRKEMGTDRPLPVQFVHYVGKLARGDMGTAWLTGRPVRYELGQRLPATIELALAALIIAVTSGHILGVAAAIKQNSAIDHVIRGYAILGASTAIFWLVLVMVYVFYYRLGWAPAPLGRLDVGMQAPPKVTTLYVVDSLLARDWELFRNSLAHLALPAVALGFMVSAPITKMVRASMLDVLHRDFVRTARTVGVSYREIIVRDALRNALIPILTQIGIVFGYLMAGNVLVEQIVAWPGIGQYAWQSLTTNDFEALRGVIMVVAVTYVLINLLIDLSYSVIDPRIRLG
ncbi:MAG TPA: ABC transporter permease [Anaerolineae bacterium]|nr:ABC transporter permease [Anaerolineae bacterium]